MSNETLVTVRGFAGSDPVVFTNNDAPDVTKVNVGVTSRYWHRADGEFRNGDTLWYEVRARGALGKNLADSCAKGTPLLVRGRLGMRQWEDAEGAPHQQLTIHADSVGIDLSFGRAQYTKTRQDAAATDGADGASSWEDLSGSAADHSSQPGGSFDQSVGVSAGVEEEYAQSAPVF